MVWHPELLHKMFNLDLPITLIKLIESFLTKRTFKVRVENHYSTSRQALVAFPRILSFTNDVPDIHEQYSHLHRSQCVYFYIRHNVFMCQSKRTNSNYMRLQRQINLYSEWFEKWHLKVNVAKTSAILFRHRVTNKQKPQLKLTNYLPIMWPIEQNISA